MEPPVWALAGVVQWGRGVWAGAGLPANGELRRASGTWRRRRARFSRAAAAVEDVGHARTGGGAGSERAAGWPGAAAGRLRRYGGAGRA